MDLIYELRPQCRSGHDMTQPQAPETSAGIEWFLQKAWHGKYYILFFLILRCSSMTKWWQTDALQTLINLFSLSAVYRFVKKGFL